MNNENKEIIKNSLREILSYYGAKSSNHNWQCVPGRHKTPNHDLSIKGNVCCCHCGLQGDSLNVISIIEGLSLKDDFPKIIKKGLEILRLETSSLRFKSEYYSNSIKKHEYNKDKDKYVKIDLTKTITDIFSKSKKNKYIYFYKRGITKERLFTKYKFIICNPKKIFPKAIIPKLDNSWTYEYIIPVWENGKVVNCILRRNDYKSQKNKKVLNLKNVRLSIFNIDYLKEKQKNLFLTEGVFDCLTFENEGYKAIALNSVVMINRFVESVKENIENLQECNLFISFDNDEKGQEFAKKLLKKLKELNLCAYNLAIKHKYKDVNEYYVKNKREFLISLNWLKKNIIERKYEWREKYYEQV